MTVVPGPEKMSDTCRKTMHTGMIDRGFIVCHFSNCAWEKIFLHDRIITAKSDEA
jgi:hypothetical protein